VRYALYRRRPRDATDTLPPDPAGAA